MSRGKVVRDPEGSGSRASTEPSGLGPAGFDPSREDHRIIEQCARIAEDYAGEMSYGSYFASHAGKKEVAADYHSRAGMLQIVAARIRSLISPEHVLDSALHRPGAKRWTDAINRDAVARIRRDSDGSPEGEKPQALSAQHDSAGPQDIAPHSDLPTPNAGDAR